MERSRYEGRFGEMSPERFGLESRSSRLVPNYICNMEAGIIDLLRPSRQVCPDSTQFTDQGMDQVDRKNLELAIIFISPRISAVLPSNSDPGPTSGCL
jgi:hypothetical protein